MSKLIISIIAALSENRAIGNNNKLLWKIPEDMRRFRQITAGHPVIMGRKTYDSIGRPLENRTNIIITHNIDFKADGCIIVSSLEDALEEAKKVEHNEIFIIGGGDIYRQSMPFADKLYLTLVKGTYDGDVFFPDYSTFINELLRKDGSDENYKYTFLELMK